MAVNDLYIKLEALKTKRAGCIKELEMLKKEKEECLARLKKYNLTEETLGGMIEKIEKKLEEKLKEVEE